MVVRELITMIGFKVNRAGISSADAATSRIKRGLGSIGSVSSMASMAFGKNAASMAVSANHVSEGIGKIKSSLNGVAGALGPIAGAMAAAFSVGAIKSAADEMMNLDGRLRTVTASESERVDIEDQLYSLSQNNRQAMSEMGDLYYKVARGAQQFGVSQEDAMRVTDIVSKSLTVGGASASEAQASILQLGQALSSGVLQGDELHSLDENASLLMQHIAENMGVTIGDLKKMGAQGMLTSTEVINAILKSGDAVDSEFGKMPMTIGQSLQMVSNAWNMTIMKIQRKTQVFSKIAESIKAVLGEVEGTVNDFMDLWNGPSNGSLIDYQSLQAAHPVLVGIVNTLKTFGDILNSISKATGIDNIVTKFILAAGAVIILGGAIGLIGSAVGAVVGVFSGLFGVVSGVFGFLAAASWPVIAAIAAIAAAIYFVNENWNLVVEAFSPGIEMMKQGLEYLSDAWTRLQPTIAAVTPILGTVANIIGFVIVDAISQLFQIAAYAFRAIAGFVDVMAASIEKAGEFIQWCIDGITSLVNKAREFLGMGSQFTSTGSALERLYNNVTNVNATQNMQFNVNDSKSAYDIANNVSIGDMSPYY